GGVELQRTAQSEPEVAPDGGGHLRPVAEGVSRRDALELRLASDVRDELHPAARADPVEAVEGGEARDESASLPEARHQVAHLVASADPAADVDAPHLVGPVVHPELRERDAHLDGPALSVALHGG